MVLFNLKALSWVGILVGTVGITALIIYTASNNSGHTEIPLAIFPWPYGVLFLCGISGTWLNRKNRVKPMYLFQSALAIAMAGLILPSYLQLTGLLYEYSFWVKHLDCFIAEGSRRLVLSYGYLAMVAGSIAVQWFLRRRPLRRSR
jgi:hypothetical protein